MSEPDKSAPLILFVDDEANAVKYFQRAMEQVAPVATAGSVEEGRRALDEHAQTLLVLVTDQRMPGGYGNELLHYASERYPQMVRILTTAYSELDSTIAAVNQGQIHRYIQKPWEIAALRVEIKQALDLARLQQEHAQLLREKMTVRQRQVAASRIAALRTLCATLTGKDDLSPLETYLSAAAGASVHPYEPDWMQMDYADLLAAEARRNGRFGYEVGEQLAGLRRRFPAWQPGDGLAPLLEGLGGQAKLADAGAVAFADAKFLTEFLGAAVQPTAQHAAWLALLLWLCEKGCALQVSSQDGVLRCALETAPAQVLEERLGYWVERFCGV